MTRTLFDAPSPGIVRLFFTAVNDPMWVEADRYQHRPSRQDLAAIGEACGICADGPCWMAPEACQTPARWMADWTVDPDKFDD